MRTIKYEILLISTERMSKTKDDFIVYYLITAKKLLIRLTAIRLLTNYQKNCGYLSFCDNRSIVRYFLTLCVLAYQKIKKLGFFLLLRF